MNTYDKIEHIVVALLIGIALGGSIASIVLEKHCRNELYKAQCIKENR